MAVQIIERFLVSIWCGANRFAHAEITRFDTTLTRLFGWSKVAGHKAIMRFFNRFDMARNEQVQEQIYRWFFDRLSIDRLTMDVGSTVITRCGSQQGAAKGLQQAWKKLASPPVGIYRGVAHGGEFLAASGQHA